jgi:Dual specificity phosphatase, catalytic domain
MRRSRVSASAELGKGTSLLMRNSGKRVQGQEYDKFENMLNSKSFDTQNSEIADTTDIEKGLADVQYGIPIMDISPMPIDQVDDNIYIGNSIGAGDIKILKNYGITHIVNTAQEIPNFFPENFEYINLGLLDDPAQKEDLSKILEPSYRYILNVLTNHGTSKILIHCHAGKSRSSTLVIYYLMRKNLMDYETALSHLKNIRWLVEPNSWYCQVLKDVSSVSRK